MADNPTTPNSGSFIDPRIFNRGSSESSGFWGNGSHWVIFLFAILIYIIDLVMKWFTGIDLVEVGTRLGINGLTNIILKGVLFNLPFWIIIAFVYFIQKPSDMREFFSKWILLATIWFILTLTGVVYSISWNNLATIMHLAFIWFGIKKGMLDKKYDAVTSNTYTIFIILLDFFAFNLIHALAPAKAININMLIIPILILSSLIYMDECSARTWGFFFLAVFYLAIGFSTFRANINFQKGLPQETINAANQQKTTAWENIKNIFTGTASNYMKTINGSDSIYAGQVEANQAKPLGVFLEDIKASDSEFFTGEKVEVWAKLKAYSFENNKDPVKIKVVCFAKDGNNIIPGNISPKGGIFNVSSFEEEFLICSFPDTATFPKTPGIPTVTFNATFNFETQSYLKTYYIDKDRKRTLTSQGVNIFQEYGISDTDPVAIYTNGPVSIGMKTTTPPIGVPTNTADFTSYIGLTIDRHWTKGNVMNVTSLDITLPPGLMLDSSCTSLTLISGATQTDGAKYMLSNSEIASDNLKQYQLPKSYMCSLKLSNYQTLLGSTPISIKYFKTNVKYTYMISESTSINIKSKPT